jgi:hypothetical protein
MSSLLLIAMEKRPLRAAAPRTPDAVPRRRRHSNRNRTRALVLTSNKGHQP